MTTVLLIVPVTLAITKELDVPPYPFLFAEVFASNIGGTATLIGDPPNILIGSLAGLDFNAFVIHLTPVIIVVMAAQALMIHLVWGKALQSTPARQALVMGMSANEAILDWTLLKQSLVGARRRHRRLRASRGRCISSPRPSRSRARRC